MINKQELIQICSNTETQRIEKTVSVTDDRKFNEAICAFANDFPNTELPGYLIIGVSDDGKRSGLTVDEKLTQKFLAIRTDGNILPQPVLKIETFTFDDGDVLVVEVQPSKLPPVRYKGNVCIRIGQRKGIANEQEEKILIDKRVSFAKTFDLEPCLGSTLSDLSIDIFKLQYLPTAIDSSIVEKDERDLKTQLASLKFYDLKNDCPTNSGILMFGNNPRFFIEGAKIQYVKFEGNSEMSNFVYETSFEGDFVTQLRDLDKFIETNVIKKKLPELGKEYEVNYPMRALKELLFNAIIHNDYRVNAPIKFYEFNDKIIITNNGGLYNNARPENFPKVNDYRNPTLAEASKNLGYVNKFNVGVVNANSALERNGNKPADYIADNQFFFQVTIYSK